MSLSLWFVIVIVQVPSWSWSTLK